jgi:hypothetical protein
MTCGPGGTLAAICILRADALVFVRLAFAWVAGWQRPPRRAPGLLRSRRGGAPPSAARADLPPVPSMPPSAASAPRRAGSQRRSLKPGRRRGSSAAARAGAAPEAERACGPRARRRRARERPQRFVPQRPWRAAGRVCDPRDLAATPRTAALARPTDYSAARRRRGRRCGCSVRSGPRSSWRAASWTARAVTVTGSSSGRSAPSETAPWSAKRRALGSTRDS